MGVIFFVCLLTSWFEFQRHSDPFDEILTSFCVNHEFPAPATMYMAAEILLLRRLPQLVYSDSINLSA